jgi:hypothetical protein
MSIDALVSGVLHGKPTARTSKAGRTFAAALVRCTRPGWHLQTHP